MSGVLFAKYLYFFFVYFIFTIFDFYGLHFYLFSIICNRAGLSYVRLYTTIYEKLFSAKFIKNYNIRRGLTILGCCNKSNPNGMIVY